MGIIRKLAYNVSDVVKPSRWFEDALAGGTRTAAGETVTHDGAMALTAYFAALRNISEDLAKIPFNLYRRRPRRGRDIQYEHPVHRLVRLRPNKIMGPLTFRRILTHRAMGWGYGAAEIVRDARGVPISLWPIHSARIGPKWNADQTDVEYEYRPDGTTPIATLKSHQVFMVQGIGDGLRGYSMLQVGAEVLGGALAAQRHANAFYGEGMTKRMIAITKEVMSPDGYDKLRENITSANQSVGARTLPVLPGDFDLKEMGLAPGDAQFIESRELSVEDIGRMVRAALHKLQYHKRAQGWNTLDALNTDWVTDSLMAWGVCWEEEGWHKLLSEKEQADHYFRHVFQALLRGDYKTRVEGLCKMRSHGIINGNEFRELEEMNPMELPDGTEDPAGDVYYIQGAMKPMTGESEPEEPEEPEEPDDTFDDEPDEGDEGDEDIDGFDETTEDRAQLAAEARRMVFLSTARRLVRKEAHRLSAALRRHASNAPAFEKWAGRFYASHAAEITAEFTPCVDVLRSVGMRVADEATWTATEARPADHAAWLEQDEETRAAALAEQALAKATAEETTDA